MPVRLTQSLATLFGGDNAAVIAWMESYNDELGGIPREKTLGSFEGQSEVVNHLETLIKRKNEKGT